jgi:hypothetical protein
VKKKCKKCLKDLSIEKFYKQQQIGSKGQICHYRDSYCKSCRCSYSSDRRRQIKKECVEYLGGACQRCGLKTESVEVYDFHHKDPKQKEIAIGRNTKSFKALKPELEKCELLCANCHRIEHAPLA